MTQPSSPDKELIRLYNEVDSFLRSQYKQDKYADHSFLIQQVASTNPTVAKNQNVMRAVAQLRNSLVHNPVSIVADPIAMPHEGLVKRYREIRDSLLNPRTALSIAVPASKIYTSTLEANLAEVMKVMDKNIFTHVPIIKEDKMVGVFSENSLLSYLAENGEAIITKDMTIADFYKYLPLSSHRGEAFEFLARRASLSEVYDIFNKAIQVHRRIGMVFITEHGRETEKPLGIITAWDLANPDFEIL